MDLYLVMGPQQGLAALASVALEFPFDLDMTMVAGFFFKSAFPTINRKENIPILLKELTCLSAYLLSCPPSFSSANIECLVICCFINASEQNKVPMWAMSFKVTSVCSRGGHLFSTYFVPGIYFMEEDRRLNQVWC